MQVDRIGGIYPPLYHCFFSYLYSHKTEYDGTTALLFCRLNAPTLEIRQDLCTHRRRGMHGRGCKAGCSSLSVPAAAVLRNSIKFIAICHYKIFPMKLTVFGTREFILAILSSFCCLENCATKERAGM